MNLGMTEILIIMVIALIVFGPRKLPELGKSLGQALAQFRRASDDFKRTWEQEVELEKHKTISSPETSYQAEYHADNSYSADSSHHYDPYSGETHTATETQQQATGTAAPETHAEPAVAAASQSEPKSQQPGAGHWI
jgi:TatA/E family protein of Tat protein translocase